MERFASVLKDLGKKSSKLTIWFFVVSSLLILPFIVNEIFGEELAMFTLLAEVVGVVVFAIYWSINHPAPDPVITEQPIQKESRGWGWGMLIVFLFLMGLGSLDDSSSSSILSSGSGSQSDTSSYTYTPAVSKTTFYTNAVSNIRSCESTNCAVIGQTTKNSPVELEHSSTLYLPEWVNVSFSQGGVQKEGYMHKSVFASSPTYSTYSNNHSNSHSNYGSNVHYDDSYKYNHRTGYSGNYGYNYDVEGWGDTGYAYGEIDTSGKYGEGYLYTEDGDEVWIETEWTGYGTIEAYDEYGNWYELEVY